MPDYYDHDDFCNCNCFIELIAVVFLLDCLCRESIFGGILEDD